MYLTFNKLPLSLSLMALLEAYDITNNGRYEREVQRLLQS